MVGDWEGRGDRAHGQLAPLQRKVLVRDPSQKFFLKNQVMGIATPLFAGNPKHFQNSGAQE